MEPQMLFSKSMPPDCDLYIGLITSDYQVRIRGGAYMGFDNASWDAVCLPDLLFSPKANGLYGSSLSRRGNPRVDVNHWRGETLDGYIVGLKSGSAHDGQRIQANWTEPRPMDYVLAAFALPKGTMTQRTAADLLHKYGQVGISIEHGGRKPRRTIGPFVTICGNPWNLDAWMMYDRLGRNIYPKKLEKYGTTGKRGFFYPICLPNSVWKSADYLMSAVLQLPIER